MKVFIRLDIYILVVTQCTLCENLVLSAKYMPKDLYIYVYKNVHAFGTLQTKLDDETSTYTIKHKMKILTQKCMREKTKTFIGQVIKTRS